MSMGSPARNTEGESSGQEFSTGNSTLRSPVSPQSDAGSPQAAVSRETDATQPPARPFAVRTAAEMAEFEPEVADDMTPLARATEFSLSMREGASRRPPAPRPRATRVFVVANQKGGVGKTTSTVNIAAGLSSLGQRVLVIDLDPQGNASTALNVEHRRGVPSTYDALVDGVVLDDVITACPDLANLWVVPATIDLAGAEIELVSVVAREGRLRKAIHGHPWVGDAASAGEEMLIPIQAEYYALEGLGQLLETVDMVRAHLNPTLAVSTILLTMYDARTRLAAGVAEEVREHFGDQVLRTAIPRSVRVSEAPSYAQTVMTYDPGSPGALSYLEAAREIASRGVSL